jgi:hypothetical protein
MVRGTVHNLRTADWDQVDRRPVLQDMKAEPWRWTVTPWIVGGAPRIRSYLIHSLDGDLYAVFIRRIYP